MGKMMMRLAAGLVLGMGIAANAVADDTIKGAVFW